MRIAFDQTAFVLQEYGGLSRYLSRLAQSLSVQPQTQARIFAPLHINAHLAGLPSNLAFGWRVPRIPKTGRLMRAVSRRAARIAIARYHPDILHESYYTADAYAPRSARRVVTVLDMIHERFPESFAATDPTSEWKRLSVARADHVLCISASTRHDLLELFGTPPERVTTVHLGFDLPSPAPAIDSRNSPPYLLYVGQRGGYKNFSGFLRAYAGSPWLKHEFSVVCFGGGAFSAAEVAQFSELGLEASRIVQRSGDDRRLARSYRQAALFVYPSQCEGFGIPPLEAMSQDCPVACGNTSSLPEVAGDAAEYFDPDDADAMRGALERVLNSPHRRDELIRRGRARLALFSWEKCAVETLAVYRNLL